ncbi:MAG: SDR family oxidoreductase [Deltaproteobacteria bacterium CG11_big_fil_rev_8_21_14_0_20_42_23]|nr:MAG: SDR family oxidoreductase [Deltaproteobacteria bacterium CG11_big_fil_rev_8_21_14_0_20_42_23]PJC64580.1 MAG: SDR family oxidoreductase [Deltaproteobacteria bacterium CG_4_9_14_0_2_um_filter_42_21]
MKIDFSGKTILITGATKGIGEQIAKDMESCGASLLLIGSNEDKVLQLNKEAEQKNLRRCYFAADFRNATVVENLIDTLCNHHTIDVCINNAGMNKIDSIDEFSNKDWNDIFSVNLQAPLLITRRVSQSMKEKRYGRIVNISSIFGTVSRARRSLYSVSKFGLRGLTVASALDLAPYNVLVNTVSPGFVLTELTKNILSKEEMEQLANVVPLGRFANPEEISKAVLFLSSDLNTYITGQDLLIDGGYVSV